MLSPQEQFVQWMYRVEDGAAPDSFAELVELGVKESQLKDPITAQAMASAYARRYWNALKRRAQEDQSVGRNPCIYCLNDNFFQFHLPSAKLRHDGNHEDAARLAVRPRLLKFVDGVSSREYEAVACVAMRLAGALHTHLTPSGNEAGVDFFALLESDTSTHLFGRGGKAIRVVGQSKKYELRESITRFNAFLAVLDNVRRLHARVLPHIPVWFRRGTGPIVGLFVSHHGVQSGVKDVAREHGIIVADTIDLCEISSLSLRLGSGTDPAQRAAMFSAMLSGVLSE